jgi:micrococcal nuclease
MKNLIPLLFLLFSFILSAQTINVKVERVVDGDTIDVILESGKKESIRFYGIDAPEGKQSYGKESTAFVKKKLADPNIKIRKINRDRYKRIVAVIYTAEGETLNLELVKAGLAWVYPKYCKEKDLCKRKKQHQEQAKKQKIDLWKENDHVAPWKYRQQKRKKK